MLCVFTCLLTFFGAITLLSYNGVNAGPLPGLNLDAEEVAGQVEGDMILTDDQLRGISAATSVIEGRNGWIVESKRWPNRIVYYKISEDFDAAHRQAILDGIDTLEARTCIRFQEADDTQPHYVSITAQSGGCYTAVGYQAKVQQMNLEVYPLNEGCFRVGTILHEFMHALGFFHQQSDAQRDDYIEVLYDNIIPGKEFNFDKYSGSLITDFDMGYDYDSCLHYRSGAFSNNGEDTIRPFDANAEIGQRVGLSEKDVQKINIMYKCPILL